MNPKDPQRTFHALARMAVIFLVGLALSACLPSLAAAVVQPPGIPTAAPSPQPFPVRCSFAWEWQDTGLVVTFVHPFWKDGLAAGDHVLAINGEPAEKIVLDQEARFSDISDPALRRAMALDLIMMSNQSLRLRVQHLGQMPYRFTVQPDCKV